MCKYSFLLTIWISTFCRSALWTPTQQRSIVPLLCTLKPALSLFHSKRRKFCKNISDYKAFEEHNRGANYFFNACCKNNRACMHTVGFSIKLKVYLPETWILVEQKRETQLELIINLVVRHRTTEITFSCKYTYELMNVCMYVHVSKTEMKSGADFERFQTLTFPARLLVYII
jgi:hypothetical protein